MKILKILLYIVLWIWQIPQHLLGFVFWLLYRKDISRVWVIDGSFSKIYIIKDNKFMRDNWKEGVSLGVYIFLDSGYDQIRYRKHEGGHTIQSLWWGPLYLLSVGLFSVLRNLRGLKEDEYYGGYPENQADALGKSLKITLEKVL